MPGRRTRSPHDWAARLAPECAAYERRLQRATGRRATLRCDRDHDELVVEVRDLHPAHVGTVADELAPLWPGFLAPAGVTLHVVDGDSRDHEAMALRSFALRGDDA